MTADPAEREVAVVLTVCTGNICRSPYAERVLRHHLAADQVQVVSAGTGAMIDHPIDPDATALLSGAGVDADGHVAQRLTRELVDAADLVLTMTREHRTAVVRLAPRAVRKTFTVIEAARLLEGVDVEALGASPSERVRRLPEQMVTVRGQHPDGPEHDDVADPYRRGTAAFQAMADQLGPSLDALVEILTRPSA